MTDFSCDPFIHAIYSGGADDKELEYVEAATSTYRPTHVHAYKQIEEVVTSGFEGAYAALFTRASSYNISMVMTVSRMEEDPPPPYASMDEAILDEGSGILDRFRELPTWLDEDVQRVILLRPFHEFLNSNRLNFSGPAGHIDAWRTCHEEVSALPGGELVRWVWNPQAVSDGMGNTAADYWPGDDVVDYVGRFSHNPWTQVSAGMSSFLTFARSKDKPLYIAEWAPNNAGTYPQGLDTPGVKETFFDPHIAWMLANRDTVRGTEFQNRGAGGSDPENALLITHPGRVELFDYWKGKLSELAAPCVAPVGQTGWRTNHFAVTPDNAVNNLGDTLDYVYVGIGGTLSMLDAYGNTVSYTVPTGGKIAGAFRRINSTGTTASGLVAVGGATINADG